MIIARENGVRNNTSSISFKFSAVSSKFEARSPPPPTTATDIISNKGSTPTSAPSSDKSTSSSESSRSSSASEGNLSSSSSVSSSVSSESSSSTVTRSSSPTSITNPTHPRYSVPSTSSRATPSAISTVSEPQSISVESFTSLAIQPSPASLASSSSAKADRIRVIIGSSIGAACFLFLALAMIFLLRTRRKSTIPPNEMDIGELKDGDGPATESASYHATHDEKYQAYATHDEEIALPFPYSQPNYASEVSLSQYSTTSSPAPSIFEAVASPEIIGPVCPSRSPDPNPFHADDASSVDVAFDNEPLFLHGADPTRFKATSPTPGGNLSRSSTVKSTGGRSSLHSRITLGVAM